MKDIPYGRQTITEADIQAVNDVLRSDFLTQGPAVKSFEDAFADFVHVKEAIAVANGTLALHLAVMALGIKPGERVLVTPNTFVASANCVRYCEGEVDFVDIDPVTLCMDLDLLEKKLRSAPKGTYRGLVTVDFAGYPVDLERTRKLADEFGLWIIEDACHALGAEFQTSQGDWSRSGNGRYADVSVFSFHPVKHLATGEGGMITTARPEIAERLRLLRTHGITRDRAVMSKDDGPWYYEMIELGLNARMPDILCALGTSQLKRMAGNIARRREIAAIYDRELAKLPLILPEHKSVRHGFHLYAIQSEKRASLVEYLRKNGVMPQVHYVPVHVHPYYVRRYGAVSLPAAEKYYSQALSLPMYHGLTEQDQARVIETVGQFFVS
jgi:UDP-4-amino-4,6-dideoxy-N-acetyl-beta-L-altrosamine transaminase